MRSMSALGSMSAIALTCGFSTLASSAQTFSARVGAPPPPMIVADNTIGRVTVPGHHRKTEEKLIYAHVRDGVYTVDGMVAKIRLNYDVQGSKYLYLFVPGVGTALVSVTPNADALTTPATLQGGALTFSADGHHFSLTGVSLGNDKGQSPAHLYVRLDRSAWRLSRTAMVGFGNRPELPYEWPGALPTEQEQESQSVPPVPASLLPSLSTVAPTPQAPVAVNPAALRPSSLQ